MIRGQTTKSKDEFRCLSPDCSGPPLRPISNFSYSALLLTAVSSTTVAIGGLPAAAASPTAGRSRSVRFGVRSFVARRFNVIPNCSIAFMAGVLVHLIVVVEIGRAHV